MSKIAEIMKTKGGTPTAYTYYQQGFTISSGCSMTDGTSGINSQLLKNDGTWTYTWDRQGRMCRKTDGSNTYGYAYDETDRLIEIIDDPDGTPSTIAAYKYDFNGNRYEKTVSSTTTQYLYSGNSIVREDDGTNAYLYYHGTRIDDILGQDDGTADAYYYKNHLGSVMQMKVGTTTDSYDYTAWGGMVTDGTNFHNPYIYTGRETAENGLYYYRARYYLPEVGRFGSKDLLANISSSYSYVNNNPILYNDPTGLLYNNPVPNCTFKYREMVKNNNRFGSGCWSFVRIILECGHLSNNLNESIDGGCTFDIATKISCKWTRKTWFSWHDVYVDHYNCCDNCKCWENTIQGENKGSNSFNDPVLVDVTKVRNMREVFTSDFYFCDALGSPSGEKCK